MAEQQTPERRDDLRIVALSLLGIIAILAITMVGLELAGSENTTVLLTLLGTIAVGPVIAAMLPLLSRLRTATEAAKTAAVNSEETKVNSEAARVNAEEAAANTAAVAEAIQEVKGQLNGQLDARIRRIVREEMGPVTEKSIRKVLLEMNLSCPADPPKGATP